jgi:hypothetical protein
MDAAEKQRILEEARRNVSGLREQSEERLVQRRSSAPLVHKTTVNEPLRRQDYSSDDQSSSSDYDRDWNNWLARGVDARLEAERQLTIDVVGEALGTIRAQLRKEFQDKLSTETRVLSEQVKALQAEVTSLRTQLAEQRAVTSFHKELSDHAVRLNVFNSQLEGLAEDIAPFYPLRRWR